MSISSEIHLYLVKHNISQTWLSEKAGIALPKLNASLKEKRKLPVDEYEKIVNALGVNANTFIRSK
jgi:hypothetical protein|nr:MAG TPA: Regulatory protein [Caudoviricetes sp.]